MNTILIVDDDKEFLNSMLRALRNEPYRVLTTHDSRTVFRLLETENVDLVLSDYLMPHMNGIELIREIRLQFPHVIPIMLTAVSHVSLIIEAVNTIGVHSFYLKPLDFSMIRGDLRRILQSLHVSRERDQLLQKLKASDAIFQALELCNPGISVKTETSPMGQMMKPQHTILIVDDEVDFLKTMQRMLRKEPYRVLTAENGPAALELLETDDVNLVLSDYMMPGMDGMSMLEEIGRKYPWVITMMLTALSDIETTVRAVNTAGVYKFFLKPVEGNSLKTDLRRTLNSLERILERENFRERLIPADAALRSLEQAHPGITHVERDSDGYYRVEE